MNQDRQIYLTAGSYKVKQAWQPYFVIKSSEKGLGNLMRIERLYDLYGSRIHHYLTLKLGSSEDAEDVVQEVFFRLVKYRMRLGLINSPQAFVFRIARNEAVRFLERNGRLAAVNAASSDLSQVISENVEGSDPMELKQISKALAEIPEDQREVIVLKFFEELTFREIASVCGISPHTAGSRYRYGMEKLRSFLEEKQ